MQTLRLLGLMFDCLLLDLRNLSHSCINDVRCSFLEINDGSLISPLLYNCTGHSSRVSESLFSNPELVKIRKNILEPGIPSSDPELETIRIFFEKFQGSDPELVKA